MNLRKVFMGVVVGLALLVGVLVGAGRANASCAVQCTVQALYTVVYAGSSFNGSYTYWYCAPGGYTFGPAGWWWYGYTYDDKAGNELAAGGRETTLVLSGNASSCPSSGTYRFIGELEWFYHLY